MSLTDFWKTNPSMFCEYVFSCCGISGHELDRFLEKTRPYLDKFSRNRFASLPEFLDSEMHNWRSFPEIGPAHAPNLNKTENRVHITIGWMSFP